MTLCSVSGEGLNILAMDTSLEYCAVALKPKGSIGITSAISEKIVRGHAEYLPKIIEELLIKAKMEIGMIDRIGVTIGPGSFSGMRVGIAMAKGLSQVLKVPLIGVSTLQAIAAEAISGIRAGTVMVLLRARGEEYYVQRFNSEAGPLSELQIKAMDEIAEILGEDTLLAGGGVLELQRQLGCKGHWRIANQRSAPNLQYVCKLTAESDSPFAKLHPIYARPADAKPQINAAVMRK